MLFRVQNQKMGLIFDCNQSIWQTTRLNNNRIICHMMLQDIGVPFSR